MKILLLILLFLLGLCSADQAVDKKPKKPKACWREGDPRGPGTLPDAIHKFQCTNKNRPEKSNGLCYPKCKSENKVGQGGICWDDCSKHVYKSSGVVFCCESDQVCKELLATVAIKLPMAWTKLVVDIAVNPAQVIKILRDFKNIVEKTTQLRLPKCSKVKPYEENEEDEEDEEVKIVQME